MVQIIQPSSCLTEREVQLDAMRWWKRGERSRRRTLGELGGKTELRQSDTMPPRLDPEGAPGNKGTGASHVVSL